VAAVAAVAVSAVPVTAVPVVVGVVVGARHPLILPHPAPIAGERDDRRSGRRPARWATRPSP
jgi:hypothetical protein